VKSKKTSSVEFFEKSGNRQGVLPYVLSILINESRF